MILPIIALIVSGLSFLHSILTGIYNKKMKEAILEKGLVDSINDKRSAWNSSAQSLIKMGSLDEPQKKIMIGLDK